MSERLSAVPFRVDGPLPTGTTVLEASAGTGKTYTVGALVTRYVAEGAARLEELLVVTFGRAASQEMRERIRQQLSGALAALADPDAARRSGDELVRNLAAVPDDELGRRRRRLAAALADFDAATIATTHQFCQQVLAGLGVAGDSDPGSVLVEDLDDLIVEVVDDLYVRGFAGQHQQRPVFGRDTALAIGRAAMLHVDARLEPQDAGAESPAARRYRFARAVRKEVEDRKRRLGLLSYDDLLSRLAEALTAQEEARDRLRIRWKVVLIDEFQDTDPVQWQVMQAAFAGHATLILIGDPKQAIYAFRGGDVVTYLAAARTAGAHATLDRNHRADEPLVQALQRLFDGAELGDPEIAVLPVSAARKGSRLHGVPVPDPVRLRVITREPGERAPLRVKQSRGLIAKDLAADIAGLLISGATYRAEDGERPLGAGDVAVLVNTHDQARLVRRHLADLGIPSVTTASGSVFRTPAGEYWLTLLEAMEQPHRVTGVRAAALTPFFGHRAVDLAEGGDEITEQLSGRLRDWSDLLARRGVAAVQETAWVELDLPGRVLQLPDGERLLTDLRHVGQALQQAATDSGLGLAALVEWLRRRRDEKPEGMPADRERRLDRDAAAVQVLTLHVSKGLQFPVVYLPFAADWRPREDEILLLHDEDGNRVLDVGGSGSPGRPGRETAALAETTAEALRLLYVGLTRAQSQLITWWAPTYNAKESGLHRMLFGRHHGSGRIDDSAPVPDDERAAERFAELQRGGALRVEEAVALAAVRLPAATPEVARLTVAAFDRELDLGWRRTSYSALAAEAESTVVEGDQPTTGEPEAGDRDDESELISVGVPSGAEAALLQVGSPMADLPGGTGFGTLVHAVLEHTDPQAADLAAELDTRCREQLQRFPTAIAADALSGALRQVLTTPLGPLADGLTLRDIAVADRLTELEFELPLAGGDLPEAQVQLADLAPLLRAHLPADDPLRGYADRLAAPGLAQQSLRGYLTGSLDAVLRLPGPRYLVADYKTNHLGDLEHVLTAWHYRPEALRQAMSHSHYPLQAILYAVALHRFLRWRQPGYDPDLHIGGVLYLYVRGMTGPGNPQVDGQPCGVFGWRPPGTLVAALSDLLDEGLT